MTRREHRFERFTAGNPPTIGGSSTDDNLDVVSTTVGSGSALVFQISTGWAAEGTKSLRIVANNTQAAITGFAGSDNAAMAARGYFNIDSSPAATFDLLQIRAVTGAAQSTPAKLTINSSRRIAVCNALGSALDTMVASLSVATGLRGELRCKKGTGTTDGTIHAALYTGDGTTPLWEYGPVTNVNAGVANMAGARLGKLSTAGDFTGYVDTLAADDGRESFIGAYSPGPPTLSNVRTERVHIVATSTGTVTLTQTSGTTAVIIDLGAGGGDHLFDIVRPTSHTDDLVFDLVADNGLTTIQSITVSPAGTIRVGELVYLGVGSSSDLANWS